jgi:hypothetical protein
VRTIGVLAALACALWTASAFAQSNGTGTPGQPTTGGAGPNQSQSHPVSADTGWDIPISSAYDQFFTEVLAADEAAEEVEKRGRDGFALRNSVKKNLGYTELEMTDLREAAMRNRRETKALDKQWNVVTAPYDLQLRAYRAQPPENRPPVMPPMPPEIKERADDLFQQRQDATMNLVENLKRLLGPEASARMENFVHRNFGRNSPPVMQHGSLPPGAEEALRKRMEQSTLELKERLKREKAQREQEEEQQNSGGVQP